MRTILITHEGEPDYHALSDDTGDCEVTVFTVHIKVCLTPLVLINCSFYMKCGRSVSDKSTGTVETPQLCCQPAVDRAMELNTELTDVFRMCCEATISRASAVYRTQMF